MRDELRRFICLKSLLELLNHTSTVLLPFSLAKLNFAKEKWLYEIIHCSIRKTHASTPNGECHKCHIISVSWPNQKVADKNVFAQIVFDNSPRCVFLCMLRFMLFELKLSSRDDASRRNIHRTGSVGTQFPIVCVHPRQLKRFIDSSQPKEKNKSENIFSRGAQNRVHSHHVPKTKEKNHARRVTAFKRY